MRIANDDPVAVDDAGQTHRYQVLTVADNATGTTSGTTTLNADLLLNDTDPDGDALGITAIKGYTDAARDGTQPRQDVAAGAVTHGSHGGEFTINTDGSWSFDPGTDFDDLPIDNSRTTSVEYTLTDSYGATDTATLTVTVTANSPRWGLTISAPPRKTPY